MVICFPSFDINISRLFTFVCLLSVVCIVQFQLVPAVDAAPGTSKRIDSSLNKTVTWRKTNFPTKVTAKAISAKTTTIIATTMTTSTNKADVCVAEKIDKTVYFFSVGYRAISGALVVPITICAICGNILVIYVIKHYRELRVTGNVFLASLAVADVGVSSLAMTFYGLQLLYGRWLFGPFMCRLWFSCDVLFSTASIIHLACIALDRYLSIVRPFDYENTSAERRRYIMILFCWLVSALLSFIPIFTGVYTTSEQRHKIDCLNQVHGRCIFAVNQAYAIVSSSFSFWVPGAIMIIMYVMLIRIADRKEREAYQIMDGVAQRRRASQLNQFSTRRRSSDDQIIAETTSMSQQISRNNQLTAATKPKSINGHSNNYRREGKHDSLDRDMDRQPSVDLHGALMDSRNPHMKHLRRERRAVKTLGSVMLAFIICWLPFFVRYTACEPDRCNWTIAPLIADIVFWVGYFNSMINPFLYAFHNRNFRVAFKKTLSRYFVCCRGRRASTTSSIGFPPATPSGESHANMKRLKKSKMIRSLASINDRPSMNKQKLSRGNVALEASNGNLTAGENSSSSKRNSCL
ncbi:unnamed protein product [Rotaria magnacalcarata]|uniref:G-protein coupled receptors family 1 profile domain-containing protein n=1 Tax=Rotaria magnacalcarata TaxID=392030 RepID=A0A819GNY3_9BILA|nr:unnamed protein product [Rotaria magnacalcarata]CAF2221477.1 unnamed protein product [Rotaria magnacalcarata]CAF3888982.1 unnamed protein product [Rotaria magnacalcarata]CAF3962665.1 unnamed protein product [Rotaria magnacalcarata]